MREVRKCPNCDSPIEIPPQDRKILCPVCGYTVKEASFSWKACLTILMLLGLFLLGMFWLAMMMVGR